MTRQDGLGTDQFVPVQNPETDTIKRMQNPAIVRKKLIVSLQKKQIFELIDNKLETNKLQRYGIKAKKLIRTTVYI